MWWRLCSLLAWFPLREAFLTNHTETVTVEEGQTLILKCVVSQEKTTSLQWLAPSGFTIFFNEYPALKNPKYQLLHYSTNRLSIGVVNVTQRDEGVYKCLHYSSSVRTKEVNVVVLATPSMPILEASVTRMQNGKEHVTLKCSTVRSKPPPQITWRLGNDIELYGEIHQECETDGKKCNSSSILRAHAHGRNSTVDCVVRHKGLRGRKLVAPFRFEDLATDHESASDALEKSSLSSQDPQQPTSTVAVMEDSSTIESDKGGKEQTTGDPDSATEASLQYVGVIRRKNGILLLTLVSFLIFILFIIVQLFIMKLRKAHVVWKKENEISEHTLESYKSRSNNEETSSQEKKGQAFRSKTYVNYITQLYSEAKTKRKENAQNSKLKEEPTPIPESIV